MCRGKRLDDCSDKRPENQSDALVLGRSRHGCDSVLAVSAVQVIAVHVLSPLPRFSEAVLTSREPMIVTAVLVSAAVVVFAACVHLAADPLRTLHRQIALGTLFISLLPNVVAALLLKPAADWPSMIALILMHVTAWALQ